MYPYYDIYHKHVQNFTINMLCLWCTQVLPRMTVLEISAPIPKLEENLAIIKICYDLGKTPTQTIDLMRESGRSDVKRSLGFQTIEHPLKGRRFYSLLYLSLTAHKVI